MSANVDRWLQNARNTIGRCTFCLFKAGPVDVAADRGYDKIDLLGQDSRRPIATVTRQEAVILAAALLEAVEYAEDEPALQEAAAEEQG